MPPATPPQNSIPTTKMDTSHMLARPKPAGAGGLPEHTKKSSSGPMIGIVIILVLMIFGALYFWGASMNREQQELPFIPGDGSILEQ